MPSAADVPPGGDVSITTAMVVHVPARIAIAVAGTTSPEREAHERRGELERGDERHERHRHVVPVGGLQPAQVERRRAGGCPPPGPGTPAAAAAPAAGHRTTTSTWGAACFIRVRSHATCRCVSPSQPATVATRSSSRRPWAACPIERPRDVALVGHQVEVLEVAQQRERPLARPPEQLGVEAVRLVLGLLAVALDEGQEGGRLAVGQHGEVAAGVLDVRLVAVRVRHPAERRRPSRRGCGAASPGSARPARQGSPARVTRTAPTLKSGCFDTGSQWVRTSSFAARPGPPSGPAASRSQ